MLEVRHVATDVATDRWQAERTEQRASNLAKVVADQLQRAFSNLDPRVIAYPRRQRLLIVWEEGDDIRTHWVNWDGMDIANPSYAAHLTRVAIGVIERRNY